MGEKPIIQQFSLWNINVLKLHPYLTSFMGMLYICPLFYKKSLFVRYIATEAYRGILPKVLDMLQKETNLPPSKIFPWQLYTPKDLSLHAEKHPDTGKAYEKIYRRKVGDPDPTKCNKNCILAFINGLKNRLDPSNTVIFIHKKKANPNNPIHRY